MSSYSYTPAAHLLERLEQVDFVAVVGPTSVGKTTLIKAAVMSHPQRLHMLVATVSRDPRPDEQDGVDFHFKTREQMERRIAKGEYATVVLGVSGDYYATAPEDYLPGKTVLMAVLADAIPMFQSLPFRSFRTVFIVPPSWEVWQERLAAHSFTAQQRASRLDEAKRSLQFALESKEVKLVINGDLATATEDFIALAHGRSPAGHLQQEQTEARILVRNLIDKLGKG